MVKCIGGFKPFLHGSFRVFLLNSVLGQFQFCAPLVTMRYEGHRTKHTRRRDHGRPGTPHTRQTGSVPGATAPMPVETAQVCTAHEKEAPGARTVPADSQLLLAYPHSRSHRRLLKPGPPGFLGTHEAQGNENSTLSFLTTSCLNFLKPSVTCRCYESVTAPRVGSSSESMKINRG